MLISQKNKKPLCYVLVYSEFDIIKKSLDCICKLSDKIDIVVIENKSNNSPKIQRFIHKLGENHKIKRYYQFEENVANTAYEVVLNAEKKHIKRASYIILTDGDVTTEDNWLEEELLAMSDKHVFACGVKMSLHNLPVKTFPEAHTWIPEASSITDLYEVAYTGVHLLMFRSRDFLALQQWLNKKGEFFIDDRMHYYCDHIVHKRWTRTRKSAVTHLTWDLYNDASNPYTQMKQRTAFDDIWRQKKMAQHKLTVF